MKSRISRYRRADGSLPPFAGADPVLDPPTDLRSKLRQVEDDLNNLRDERADKVRKREEAKSAFAAIPGYDTGSEEFKRAQESSREVADLDEKITEKHNAQVGILKLLGQDQPTARNGHGPTHKAATPDGWDSRRIIDGDAYKALQNHPALRVEKARVGTHVLGEVANREALKAVLTSGDVGGLIQPEFRGLNLLPLRPLRLLDLLPVGNTTASSIDYVQEVSTALGVAEVAEGAQKPEVGVDFTDATAVVRTIAGWIKINKQALADAPGLQAYIDNRLRYKVRRRLEEQILAGDGAGQNLRGILNITGVQATDVTGGGSVIDRMHHGIVAVQLADHEPNFMAMNPRDFERVRLAREENAGEGTATGGYLMAAPAVAGGQVLFGLPVVVLAGLPEGTALVGDTAAALVLLREGVQVLISDSDQDDFIRNRVTMLGETRAGVMLWAPDAFATVDLGTAAP